MNKLSILVILMCIYTSCTNTEEKKSDIIIQHIHFQGKEYNELILNITLDNNSSIKINGISEDRTNWTFIYSDSVYERHQYMSLSVPTPYDTLTYRIGLYGLNEADTFKLGSYTVDKHPQPMHLSYIKSDTVYKAIYYGFRDGISDSFMLTNQKIDDELLIISENFGYCLFYEIEEEGLSYEKCVQKYEDIAKKHPDSHYLISRLAETLTYYKSKDDVAKVYNQFSKNNRESYYGKKINSFINLNYFENDILPAWDTSKEESVLQDTTKYSLVVFSASWCGPCHKQIPLLKEIYNDLNKNLNIVYISMDEESTADRWRELMRKENIPWRSVMAFPDLKNIRAKYYAYTIPHTLLVYPNGKMEIFDVRENKNKDKLYQLININ